MHRWVLLKNSIHRSQPSIAASSSDKARVDLVYNTDAGEEEEEEEDEEVCAVEEHDSFMFPDAGKFVDRSNSGDMDDSEEQWFESLLETLGDEDEDDSDVQVSLLHVDDDDDYSPYSPLTSPMSSSDDLTNQPVYHDPPIPMPYPIVYPPYHPPLIRSFELDSLNSFDSSFPPLNIALPYYDADDMDDPPVPDAIEDVSDDESDALSTPSYTRSTSSLLDQASHVTRERMRRPLPQVYVDTDDTFFSPFELDPLPFPDDHRTSPRMFNNVYHQEC